MPQPGESQDRPPTERAVRRDPLCVLQMSAPLIAIGNKETALGLLSVE